MATEQKNEQVEKSAAEQIAALKEKSISIPTWGGKKGLQAEYDSKMHPVMNKSIYPDIVDDDGIEFVTRITQDLQRLSVKRMSELCNGIPVKRLYKPAEGNENQQKIAKYLEAIFQRNRIDSVNIERSNMLFAGCEVMTLWYAVEQKNNLYGFDSSLKFRCRNFSPMLGDELYPLFDEYGDMIAMSVGYTRKIGRKNVQYFDTYSATEHIKWSTAGGEWAEIERENITIGKIPAIYIHRPTPIWEDTSNIVYEIEWALSRNGNYLRKNSKPVFCVFADEEIDFGEEGNEKKEFKSVLQYPKGSTAGYITWAQAIENLRFYVTELRQSFFTQLQLPDWSYDNMKTTPMSGEARKQMFIDCQLKVKDESGRIIEGYDREMNVAKALLKVTLPEAMHADVDALQTETVVTPFTINDEKDEINNIITATGGKPIMSQREGVIEWGKSNDVDQTMKELAEENVNDSFGLTR